jgi:hypothetical protein
MTHTATDDAVPPVTSPAHEAALHLVSDDLGRCLSQHCDGIPTLLRGTV